MTFDVVCDYTVKMWTGMTQRFVMLRGGIAFIFVMTDDKPWFHFGEVECSPEEFLESIKMAEAKVRSKDGIRNSEHLDWGGWWDSIKFNEVEPEFGSHFTTSVMMKTLLENDNV